MQIGKVNSMQLTHTQPPIPAAIKTKPDAVFFNYTQEELQQAFDKIKTPSNWKEPIQATIPAEDYNLASAAVAYFTGSQLEIEDNTSGQYIVYAAGYYAAIGS
jgi:hypothetical protein